MSHEYYGNVEICYNGTWGTVCSDEWDYLDGSVVCKQLGYSHAVSVYHASYYGIGTGPIWMDNVQCNGHETSLSTCTFKGWGINDCTHHNDAGVACKSKMESVFIVILIVLYRFTYC